jgi:Transposase and inactivated derivatives
MDTIYPDCAGLDVHKDSVYACVRHLSPGGKVRQEVRAFGTATRALLELSDWLAGEGVTHVAMESTGVYWKPVWNVLEDRFDVMVVNARHIKQVPGRKTDVKDCQWIAQLLQHGLLKASFVPDRPLRELRDLTRQRAQLIQERSRVANRVQKTLEDANIKLASVASDALGASGRQMIQALIDGNQTPEQMADLARRRLREKIPQLREALSGKVTDHHRFMLRQLMEQMRHLEGQVETFDARIEQVMGPLQQAAVGMLDQIPGLDVRAAQNIVAEIGVDMSRFPSAAHLSAWAGLCPGNNRSAGKRKRGKMTEGNRWLKRTLTQCAWAASRTKGSYFQVQYRRLAGRRGKKRAAAAVGHSQLVVAYHMLRDGTAYEDLGPNHFDNLVESQRTGHLVKRLEKLGFRVTLEKAA